MRRTQQDCAGLQTWLDACDIELHGVEVQRTQHGSGIVTVSEIQKAGGPMIEVPSRLVLSLEYVWQHAEKDLQLKQCLEAVGEFAKTARGAILIFLLMQVTATSPDVSTRIGVENPWTTYVQYLPTETNLPTHWTDEQRHYVDGTSLQQALASKLSSLLREFEHLKSSVKDIAWCQEHWLDPSSGCLSFDDWKLVDSIWRSRAMEIPSHGLCMVPIADMANHAHGHRVNSRTHVDVETGDVHLVLNGVESVRAGSELAITYGQEKGACEMLFSYGFIDAHMDTAESIFLDLPDPGDDPIFLAKKHIFDCAPGVRIAHVSGDTEITWFGEYVWLMCINEEDGLEFAVVGEGQDDQRLVASWNGRELTSVTALRDAIAADPKWSLFRLRAYATVNGRIGEEMDQRQEQYHGRTSQSWWPDRDETSQAWKVSELLRDLEWQMLKAAKEQFEMTINWLYQSPAVQEYFGALQDQNQAAESLE